jgi:glycosyltransferase involved in cell wall biosynthesis
MIIGIDCSGIKVGGGALHIKRIISNANPDSNGFTKIIIWGSNELLSGIESKPWLIKRSNNLTQRGAFFKFYWEIFHLHSELLQYQCDILFSLRGFYLGFFRPFVLIFQNMQIFEKDEICRERYYLPWFRLKLLQYFHIISFKSSSGVIFLSEYSRNYLLHMIGNLFSTSTQFALIEHGIDIPSNDVVIKSIPPTNKTIVLLYVSTVKEYKHQWKLVDAVTKLNNDGYSVVLNLVGSGDKRAIIKLNEAIKRAPLGAINYYGDIRPEDIGRFYSESDIFVFLSTCETFGITLLEAMSFGLPIICSNKSPMVDILKDAGIYVNPESIESIYNGILYLFENSNLCFKNSEKGFKYSNKFSWVKCTNHTFEFLNTTYNNWVNKN